MPVRRAESVGWAGARSPTSEGGREGREGTVDSLEIDQREGFGVWQRSRRAIRSTDPGRSAWWIVPPVIGATLGSIAPFIAKLEMPWRVLIGLVIGLSSQVGILQERVSKKSQYRHLAESSGIYKSIVGKKLEELLVHNSDRDDSEFLPRDIQEELIRNIKSRTPTLIVGPSMSGKTRLVVETVRKTNPSTSVWLPKEGEDIQRVYDNNLLERNSIIIFDDIDRFLSNQTLSLGQLDEWIRGSCTIIATMMKSSYRPWRDEAEDKLPGWDVVNRFTIIQMDTLLTENEQVALSRSSSYADLAAAAEKVGLAPLLGGAPKLRQRLEEGREQHLWGYALVRAAADWRRVGLGPATKTQIQEVALVFKDDIAWGKPNWKKAWKWASHKLNDTVSLIRQTGSHEWEVLDLVADEADWLLSQQTLEAMAGTEHSSRQALAISLTMHMRGVLDDNKPVLKQTLQEADEFLHKLTTESTSNSDLFGLYAFFLMSILHDNDRAEKIYEQAIIVNPNHANILGNYAIFLWTIRHDRDRAEEMYRRAIEADPANVRNANNYANFLMGALHDSDRTEEMYEQAIVADPSHTVTLSNYANFLWTIRHDLNRAQKMYERAITADPNYAETLGAYALFLEEISKDDHDRTEEMYKRAIKVNPNHIRNLNNYALFLTNILHNYDRAEETYKDAIEVDPTNAYILGNYALFLETIRRGYDRAEDMFERAIDASPKHARNLGNYANFLKTVRGDSNRAQAMYERAVDADPTNANSLGNYSQLLFATGQDEAAIVLATRALSLASTDEKPLVAECRFYLFAHSPEHRRESGESLRDLLAAGVTTGSWSFEPNLERLRREKDPRYDLVRDVADALSSGDTQTLESRGEWYAL